MHPSMFLPGVKPGVLFPGMMVMPPFAYRPPSSVPAAVAAKDAAPQSAKDACGVSQATSEEGASPKSLSLIHI